MSVTYRAVLPVHDETVDFLAGLLAAERVRRGTRADTRALSCRDRAVLVPRWFLDGTRKSQLARDNAVGESTGYDYLHEGIDVLAARAPSLNGAAGRQDGRLQSRHHRRSVDRDRPGITPGPTPGVDLWWSGKHANHGGNVQVITAPDGWPTWTSDVRPGREHDTTAVRTRRPTDTDQPDTRESPRTCKTAARRDGTGRRAPQATEMSQPWTVISMAPVTATRLGVS